MQLKDWPLQRSWWLGSWHSMVPTPSDPSCLQSLLSLHLLQSSCFLKTRSYINTENNIYHHAKVILSMKISMAEVIISVFNDKAIKSSWYTFLGRKFDELIKVPFLSWRPWNIPNCYFENWANEFELFGDFYIHACTSKNVVWNDAAFHHLPSACLALIWVSDRMVLPPQFWMSVRGMTSRALATAL